MVRVVCERVLFRMRNIGTVSESMRTQELETTRILDIGSPRLK